MARVLGEDVGCVDSEKILRHNTGKTAGVPSNGILSG